MKRLLTFLLLSLPWLASAQVAAPDTAAVALVSRATPALADSVALPVLPTDTIPSATAAAPDSVPAALRGLSAEERMQRGRADAGQHYRPRGAFWAGFGAGTVVPALGLATVGPVGIVGGLGTAVGIGAVRPKAQKLQRSAPEPELLRDPDYYRGYSAKASGRHLGKTMLGWGVGTVVGLATLITVLAIALSGGGLAG
ncbi:hypothetical protein [Hymenobacter sp. CRA2]|uniref:hypothetical protein n=1 Tax=Hymenobacter sp. CRA2 TaxID=1955620 RepID=UPI00098FD9B7|nr:hypothetical protein [Hymenobacter sp. CRA2]OON68198.1 hypothetical protein B0919_13645 [Hymenobacter sp. CRA2]